MTRTASRSTWITLWLLLAGSVPAQTPTEEPALRFPSDKVRSALLNLLPSGVDLDKVEVEEARVRFSGSATDTVQLSQFIRRVEQSAEFELPNLEKVDQVDGMSAFTLIAEMKCPSAEPDRPSTLCKPVSVKQQTVFKCLINGTVTFQGHPCPPEKKS